MKRKIQLVIFDLDGTLIDAYAAVAESVNYTLHRLGYPPVSGAKIKRGVGWGEVHLLRKFFPPQDLQHAVAIYRRHHPEALRRGAKLLPGARQVLGSLKKRKYLLAVASNRATRFTKIIAQQLKIDRYFDFILCRDKVARPKPYPDILKGILRHFSVVADQVIFVGDMVVDIQAGRGAGVRTVAVVTGSSTGKEIAAAKPWRIIRNIQALRPLLKREDSLVKGNQLTKTKLTKY